MNDENTKKEELKKDDFPKQKINDISQKAVKVINVVRKVFQVIMIILAVLAVCFLVIAVSNSITGWLSDYITNHPEFVNGIEIPMNKGQWFIKIADDVSLQELVASGHFNKFLYSLFAEMIVAIIDIAIIYYLLLVFRGLFAKLATIDSPYSEDLVIDVKRTFIVVSILVLINEFFIGIIVSLVLTCFYYMYKYGCKLQKESDETI